MSQSIDATARQQANLINSPVFKAVSCIPLVGHVSSLVADVILYKNTDEVDKTKNVNGRIEVLKKSKEYTKIAVARNLLSAVLVVGAIALGILSGLTGAILVSVFFVAAMVYAYDVKTIDQNLNSLKP